MGPGMWRVDNALFSARMTSMISARKNVLVHLASGIGNIIFATPLLLSLAREGFSIDVVLDADYPEVTELFLGWSAIRSFFNGGSQPNIAGTYDFVIPAIPPFYWHAFKRRYERDRRCVPRPRRQP